MLYYHLRFWFMIFVDKNKYISENNKSIVFTNEKYV